MRLTFTYSHLLLLTPENHFIFETTFEVPDTALQFIGIRERIFRIAELVSKLSLYNVFLTCKELNFRQVLVEEKAVDVRLDWYSTFIVFSKTVAFRTNRTNLRLLAPNIKLYPDMILRSYMHKKATAKRSLTKNLKYPNILEQSSTHNGINLLKELTSHITVILNADTSQGVWGLEGFNIHWFDKTLYDQRQKYFKDQEKQQKSREREELKRQKREEIVKARQLNPDAEPKTGAGRTVGARPGVFEGVMMRSQLEIRFAAELKERNIRWIYEGETLGKGGYLVDFYLPDLGVWVEVKGKFEARDKHLLPEVAEVLKTRKQSLFVYTNGTCYKVNPSGLREIPRKDFWGEVVGG